MQYILKAPASFNATIKLPASKSISNRALIIHALSNSDVLPQNLSVCDDTEVVVNALMSNPDVIDIKAAGTAMRFMTAYLSVTPGEHVITGTERMQNRPIGILVDALRYLGADIEYVANEGYPPLRIKGHPLEGGYLEIPGNVSSQYISALHKYLIESDWSASSYWYEMMALTDDTESQLMFEGLMDASKQGDSIVKYIYSLMGVKTRFAERADNDAMPTVTLKKQRCMLPRLDYDFISAPDLAQTVVVTCALLDIPFKFTGLASLKIKETDRIEALKRELRKLGYVLRDENNDTLIWDGATCEPTFEPIDTYEDHRMAMAFAPAAIKFPGLRINDPYVVTKSYPQFWDDLESAGWTIEKIK